jgi:hypothetical protein
MANKSGKLYGLTAFIPIKNQAVAGQSCASVVRKLLQEWSLKPNAESPMAKVPNTYLCRFYVLNDVFYQGSPAREEHLQSRYLVFYSNFHGELEPYLKDMWNQAQDELQKVLQHCVAFDGVNTVDQFVAYMKRCQVPTTFLFNGSTDEPLEEQLKSLYLKQAFSHFVFTHHDLINKGAVKAAKLQQAFKSFVEQTQPSDLNYPTWKPGWEKVPDSFKKKHYPGF